MFSALKRKASRNKFWRWMLLPPYRTCIALRLIRAYTTGVVRWLWSSKEYTNWTYDLAPHSLVHLSEFLHGVTGVKREQIAAYMDEIVGDKQFYDHLRQQYKESPHAWAADREARLGRRIGWYVLVRAFKPRLVVESGIAMGLGTCTLAAAALRNQAEGTPTRLIGLDIDPDAGWLLGPPYSDMVEIMFGDSHDTLPSINQAIDLFIFDSNHSYEHEATEYQLIRERLARGAIVVSDNAHAGSALIEFARSLDSRFHFWLERLENHFYAGAGIGLVVTGESLQASV